MRDEGGGILLHHYYFKHLPIILVGDIPVSSSWQNLSASFGKVNYNVFIVVFTIIVY